MVDDSEDNQHLLTSLFFAQGWKAYSAINGRDALLLLRELSQLPDLILLDAEMPIMNGFDFRREQRKDKRLKNIPVVVMSGNDELDLFSKMLRPKGILSKPFKVQSLVNQVSEFL